MELNLTYIAKAQNMAKETMLELNREITVGMSEKDISLLAKKKMEEKGSDEWWYHNIPGLVLLGKHSAVSVGSKDLRLTDEYRVAENDIITIDIAPTYRKGWGDYARTLFMEDGKLCPLDHPQDPKHKEGLDAELYIHRYMVEHCNPDMTYEEIFETLNAEIRKIGFRNLDFKGNLGHSIEIDQADRIYLEKGNTLTVREAGKPFTLEPHIANCADYGFKRENIYLIEGDRFVEL
jgi:Xaa-Pro aminopeptidase